jgi:hypothetical protein
MGRGEELWEEAVRKAMLLLLKDMEKRRGYDEYVIRTKLQKEFSITKREATDIIYEAADEDHLDLGDVPFSGKRGED